LLGGSKDPMITSKLLSSAAPNPIQHPTQTVYVTTLPQSCISSTLVTSALFLCSVCLQLSCVPCSCGRVRVVVVLCPPGVSGLFCLIYLFFLSCPYLSILYLSLSLSLCCVVVLGCVVLSCLVLSCLVLSCYVLSCVFLVILSCLF
jgi:hypothetical protein